MFDLSRRLASPVNRSAANLYLSLLLVVLILGTSSDTSAGTGNSRLSTLVLVL